MPKITILPDNRIWEIEKGLRLRDALLAAGEIVDAPCGGQGTCGKCKVLCQGEAVLACQTPVDRDLTVTLPPDTGGPLGDPQAGSFLAFDIGTTTLTCQVLDRLGHILQAASVRNPQVGFGADVVSRIRAASAGHRQMLTAQIRSAMEALIWKLCANPQEIETVCVVGNPAMQQLFLGKDLSNLAQIPFKPILCKPEMTDCAPFLPICPRAKLLIVPDISGFVGADTVAAVLSCGMQDTDELTLLVDIGTNAELVLGNRQKMVACAAAAGPALEGANISCGMRYAPGAIHRVRIENGRLCWEGAQKPVGICGSGLIDAVACALELGLVNQRGKILDDPGSSAQGNRCIRIADGVSLTQEDIRQVQLAKGAIRAGIGLMMQHMDVTFGDIHHVVLAGTFGATIDPASACRIGLLPDALLPKARGVGNAAVYGAAILAADPGKLDITQRILDITHYLDLSTHPAFPKTFAKAMRFREDWAAVAKNLGFDYAQTFDPAILQAREDVRAMCAADRCHAYGKNWTCPPHCGSLEECQRRMGSYKQGILVQTLGHLHKTIDTRAYRETEERHLESFAALCKAIRRGYPEALCLGAGGCRVCKRCAFPEPCRFPEQAVSSMEGYGLFVTQVCRDVGLSYYHGEKTITYTGCILYG